MNKSMSDNNDLSSGEKEKTSKTNVASTEEPSSEVFDSSTYDSMTDLKASATLNETEVNKVVSDTKNKEPIEPEAVHIESSTTNVRTSPSSTTVAPTMEGRASTLKKSKESQNNNKSISKQLDKQTSQINKKK